MKNLFIAEMHKKDVKHFTSNIGLKLRRDINKTFKIACNVFTNANILNVDVSDGMTDEEYFESLDLGKVPLNVYDIKENKNNIILERYPELNPGEPYIFVCNHTCPEDIETVLNILDRNAYLVLGSIETIKYNPEAYLLWANGMIPFDIMDETQRKQLMAKMERVIKTNSILIFPEGSHNYSPNKLINKLFDGPVNLSLKTGRKIVPITLLRDQEKCISYVDVGNPIDLNSLGVNRASYTGEDAEKKYVNALTSCLRDKMATAVYHMLPRHFDEIGRSNYGDIEEHFRREKIDHAFSVLKWNHDVFDAEYLVKKTKEDKAYEEVISTLSNLRYSPSVLKKTMLGNRDYVLLNSDLKRKDVASVMRQYWLDTKENEENSKSFVKKR